MATTATNQADSYQHYYVPDSSNKPILATIGLGLTIYGFGLMLNQLRAEQPVWGHWLMAVGMAWLVAVVATWFSLAVRENLAGLNSGQMKRSYVYGMAWFIFSEVMFFFIFFFALFYVRVFAGPWLGGSGENQMTHALLWNDFQFQWPLLQTPQEAVGGVGSQLLANNGEFIGPERSMAFPGWGNMLQWLPLWNTLVLLTSSVTVHYAHLGLKAGNRRQLDTWLGITILLGLTFVGLQALEYYEAYAHYGLTLHSGVYGSTFFMLTGFHGFHVCLGALMLLVMWLRAVWAGHFTADDHFGFEAASWYWHFVDVVWVCLFLFVYIL